MSLIEGDITGQKFENLLSLIQSVVVVVVVVIITIIIFYIVDSQT